MCEALEKLSEEEGRTLQQDVAKLVAWKNRVSGALLLASALMVIGMWILNRSVARNDDTMEKLTTTLVDLRIELAGFREEVQPFIAAGPRFTAEDYRVRIKADLAEFKETLPPEAARQQTENIKNATEFNRTSLESMMRRIEALERRENPPDQE